MSDEPEVQNGISRRRMLKRIGAGAAVSWSAPALTSLRAPAFAQTPPAGCEPAGCPNCGCDPGIVCGLAAFCNPDGCRGSCLCVNNNDQTACDCKAFPSNFCADYPPCESDADCPVVGQCCMRTCCPAGICMDPCTSNAPRTRRRSGIGGPRVTVGVENSDSRSDPAHP
jgi:hypothetical protein